ncbi:MAG: lactate racemase domain-containing protein [Synergistaceae bacterium]|nr:lactate racemase domain-containing protein [Synergistaceae bacterium]
MSIASLLKDIPIPDLMHVKYKFHGYPACDYKKVLNDQINMKKLLSNLKPGARVGITAGSRGVSDLPIIIKEIVDKVKQAGGSPFVFPAMGSHGGATAEGQRLVLKKLGITEDFIGCEICSSMETVLVGRSSTGLPVYMDKFAWESDGVIVLNRVKPHTTFRGNHESGIVKMLVIGMGKQKGAEICHQLGFKNMAQNIEDIAKVVLSTNKVLFGVGVVENPDHQICCLDTAEPEEFFEKDAKMLKSAWDNLPRLPFSKVDVLVIDEIGKEISGTGFDTNAVGRANADFPEVTRIAVLNLSEKTAGNANGIGRADTTTKKVFERFSFEETYPNAITSTAVESVRIPMILDNDELAIKAAIKMSLAPNLSKIRLVRIKNTSNLGDLYISSALLDTVKGRSDVYVCNESLVPLIFNVDGNIKS